MLSFYFLFRGKWPLLAEVIHRFYSTFCSPRNPLFFSIIWHRVCLFSLNSMARAFENDYFWLSSLYIYEDEFQKEKNPSKLTKFSSTYPWPCKWATAMQHTFGDVYNIDIYLIGRIGRNFVFSLGVFSCLAWRCIKIDEVSSCVCKAFVTLFFLGDIYFIFFSAFDSKQKWRIWNRFKVLKVIVVGVKIAFSCKQSLGDMPRVELRFMLLE